MTMHLRLGDLLLVAAMLVLGLTGAQAGSHGKHAPGSGYGLQGGVSPDLALANVFSGIYGLGYTYDRANYDFNGCGARAVQLDPRDLTIRPCR